MLGGPQNSQVEPQNLSTSQASAATQSMVMLPPGHTHQWVMPPSSVHMMPFPQQEGTGPQTNNASTQVNTSHPPPVSQSSHMHMTQDQMNQIPGTINLWNSQEMSMENGTNGAFGMTEIREEEVLPVEEETKPKIKKEVRKKRKLADLLAEGIDPTKLEENSGQVRERFDKGCECEGDNCFKNMNPDFVFRHRLNIAELTKNEHDMYLMGVTMACLANPDETSRHKERKRLRASYVFQGKKVCLDAFLYLENCTHYQLKAIRKHVMGNGVTPRVHGNHGKKPPNTFPLDTYQHASAFLQSFINRYTTNINSPKKQNKSGKSPPIYLPSDVTRKKIHNAYKEFSDHFEPNMKVMGYSSFRHFMKEQFHNVKFYRIDKKNERIAHSDDDEDDNQNGQADNQQQPQHQQEQRPEHRIEAPPQQVMQQPQHPQDQQQQRQEPQKETRNTPPTTIVSDNLSMPPNSHPVAQVSMTHAPVSSAYQGYSHVPLPLNLQTQQPLYAASCMQPGVFPPGQHPPQARPPFSYSNL